MVDDLSVTMLPSPAAAGEGMEVCAELCRLSVVSAKLSRNRGPDPRSVFWENFDFLTNGPVIKWKRSRWTDRGGTEAGGAGDGSLGNHSPGGRISGVGASRSSRAIGGRNSRRPSSPSCRHKTGAGHTKIPIQEIRAPILVGWKINLPATV
jgi:hypothetical protein